MKQSKTKNLEYASGKPKRCSRCRSLAGQVGNKVTVDKIGDGGCGGQRWDNKKYKLMSHWTPMAKKTPRMYQRACKHNTNFRHELNVTHCLISNVFRLICHSTLQITTDLQSVVGKTE